MNRPLYVRGRLESSLSISFPLGTILRGPILWVDCDLAMLKVQFTFSQVLRVSAAVHSQEKGPSSVAVANADNDSVVSRMNFRIGTGCRRVDFVQEVATRHSNLLRLASSNRAVVQAERSGARSQRPMSTAMARSSVRNS